MSTEPGLTALSRGVPWRRRLTGTSMRLPVRVCGTPGTSMTSSGTWRGESCSRMVCLMRSRRASSSVGAGGEVDEERHPVAAVGLFDADDEGLADLGEAFDGFVDVGGAHADALAVEGGVGAAVDDDGAAGGDGDPVAVAPDAGVRVEVAVVVAAAVGVVPEADRHGRHGVGDDQFADLVDERFAAGVPGLEVGAEAGGLEFADVDREGGDGAGEAAAHVGAAADGGDPQVLARPRRGASGSRRAAAASRWWRRTGRADRSRSRPGWTPALRQAMTYAAEVPKRVAPVRSAIRHWAPVSG